MSRTQPVFGRTIDSIKSLVPGSTRLFEKTLEAVKNSKPFPHMAVRTKPNLSFDLGSALK
jgi:hypothetical protein